jgi:alpha-beta hydrolase superfamily lysophospholipase
MTNPLGQPIGHQVRRHDRYQDMVVTSVDAPIVLSVWRGDPSAPTVVFLPGTMTHPLFYAEFLDGLNQRGLSVVGVHYQGHGKSLRIRRRLRWDALVANAADAVVPRLPVPLWAYLDLDRVCRLPQTRARLLADPSGSRAYPLGFLVGLLTADLSGLRDGSIPCPVLVIAATGDPLFSFGYTRRVYDRIVAPSKQLLVFDADRHLLFNECVELVLDPLVDRIRTLATAQPAASMAGDRR